MATISIRNGVLELKLTWPRSKIRICDNNGNHVSRPTSKKINFSNHYIEWMITNNELLAIVKQKFTKRDILGLINKLQKIRISLKNSDFSIRAAQKQNIKQTIKGFLIYRYKEIFYSFEKKIDANVQVKITFKMGDYALAAHMFVLIGFINSNIVLKNLKGNIKNNNALGSGAKCFWRPPNNTISEIAKALASSSEDHKNDLIRLLRDSIV